MSLKNVLAIVAASLLLACVLACGGVQKMREAAARSKATNDLKQIALAYHNSDAATTTPKNADELGAFMPPEEKTLVAQMGPGGKYVVFWDVKISSIKPGEKHTTILAYESETPSKGGPAAFADGSVRQITAEEFAAAPKANTKTEKK
jgi:hypothetical protein